MPGPTSAAARVTIAVLGILASLALAELVSFRVLGLFLSPNSQGSYTITRTGGEARWLAVANLVSLATSVLLAIGIVKLVYRRRRLDRPLVVLGGYAGACIVAGLVLLACAAGFASGNLPVSEARPRAGLEDLGSLYLALCLVSVYIGVLALLPAAAIIAYAERRGLRSPLFYGGAGAVAAVTVVGAVLLVLLLAGAPQREVFRGASPLFRLLLLFAAPGLAGGLTYWLIAGRKAGERPPSMAARPVD
ncbi:hypothetical protein [Phreatobacter stygius]|uniref:Uncharacterized protein n=1 Tax=Phreatobacter stygius TaxID=1940610 RepID=A0A4D7B437_9HYPH|nr:hypothetical protein [Phreatobacter stygius]QCI64426.1 hypothetical protein E8M01_09395 [Phreatobacter stygius]